MINVFYLFLHRGFALANLQTADQLQRRRYFMWTLPQHRYVHRQLMLFLILCKTYTYNRSYILFVQANFICSVWVYYIGNSDLLRPFLDWCVQ